MDSHPPAVPAPSPRIRTVTLAVGLLAVPVGVFVELAGVLSEVPGAGLRMSGYIVIWLACAYQMFRSRRTEPVMIVTAAMFGAIGLFDSTHMNGLGTPIILSLIMLLGIGFVITRRSTAVTPVLAYSTGTFVYAIAMVIIERPPPAQVTAMLLLAGPGQMLLMWITLRLIHSLAQISRHEAAHARIQQALATCSQALLTGRDDQPLSAALKALLDATEADYAYIDVNRVDRDGNVTWEIVADASGDDIPDGADEFDEGDYDQFPEVVDRLASGRSARIRVSDLPMPIRGRYEAEGIQSELMAPIMIRDQWVGTLGYSDFWRDDAWTDVEVDGLMRAADMVAAYWERESAREGLEELAKAKDRFIATVSHELRTPLAAVVGFAGELAQGLDRYSREEILEMVGLISTQSLEVAQLVDDLLTAERAASGNLTVKPAVIDLLEESRSLVGSLHLGLDVTIEGDRTEVWADTLRIRQILRNLLTNAQRYGGKAVRINVAGEGAMARVVVSDDGPGVKGIDAEHIFDPYYRSQTPESRPDSVGLGLAVARQLARMMDGDLVYRRRRGWTNFELTLPAAARATTPALT